jgi:hypothetical protein
MRPNKKEKEKEKEGSLLLLLFLIRGNRILQDAKEMV